MTRTVRTMLFVTVVLMSLGFVGCFAPVGGPQITLQISVEETDYTNDATFDFGALNVGAEPLVVTALVTNLTGSPVMVTELAISGPFSVEAREVAFLVAEGQSVEVSLSFDPVELGEASGTLEVSIEGFAQPFILNLTGSCVAPLKVTIGATDYASGASYDFGFVDPDAAAVEVAVSLVNLLAEPVTVTDLSSGADGITLTLLSVPFDISAESSVAGTLVFDPSVSGSAAAQFDVAVEGVSGAFTLNVAGEGNYAPVANALVVVSGAGTTAVNGTYYRTEEVGQGYPVYRLSTEYVLYGSDSDGGIRWSIDSDFDPISVFYSNYTVDVHTAPNGTPTDWDHSGGVEPYPASVGEIVSSSNAVDSLPEWDEISPNYLYSDAEEDSEGTTLYQWYWADAPAGTYMLIPGATDATYTVGTPDHLGYLKVLVTPVATDGITTGEPIWFGPSPVVDAPGPV